MDIVRRLLPALLAGCLAGVVAAVAMIALDVGALWELIAGGPDGWLGGALLTFGLATTFGSAAVVTAVCSDSSDDR